MVDNPGEKGFFELWRETQEEIHLDEVELNNSPD